MLGDMLAGILGEAVAERIGSSGRARVVARLAFGLLGFSLAVAGAVRFSRDSRLAAYPELHASMIAVFVFLACFALFNVALARTWRWPGRLFVLSFVALIVARLVLGP